MTEIETLCKGCIFGLFEKNEETNQEIQVGCHMGLLDKFGIDINTYEEKNIKYFGIPNRVCVFNRGMKWADEKSQTKFAQQSESLVEALTQIARQEVQFRNTCVIVFDTHNTLDDLKITVDNLQSMDLKPIHIIILDNSNISRYNMLEWCIKNIDMQWRVEDIYEDTQDINRILDIGFRKSKTIWMTTIKAGATLPLNFFDEIDKKINDDLDRFVLLLPYDDINGMTCMRNIVKMMGGNSEERTIIDKLIHISEVQECQNLVKKAEEICPLTK